MSSVTNLQDENSRAPIRIKGRNEDLPKAFNFFYSWFENHDLSDKFSLQGISSGTDCNMVISEDCVHNLLKKVNVRKACGP